MAISKVVIPVAGLGTRGLPATKVCPKELLPIIDVPTIQYIVEEAVSAGLTQVVFVTSRGKSMIEDYFDASPHLVELLKQRGKEELAAKVERVGSLCEVLAVRQKEPKGLGHAIACAKPLIGNEPFAVCLGDQIFPPWEKDAPKKTYLSGMVEEFEKSSKNIVGVIKIRPEASRAYGIVDLSGADLQSGSLPVKQTVEKPEPEEAPSPFAIVGRYVFQPEILDLLSVTKPGKGGEIQLTDAMNVLATQGKLLATLFPTPGYDVGDAFYFVKAQLDNALIRPALAERVQEYLRSLSL